MEVVKEEARTKAMAYVKDIMEEAKGERLLKKLRRSSSRAYSVLLLSKPSRTRSQYSTWKAMR
jgi:hypothetical protein